MNLDGQRNAAQTYLANELSGLLRESEYLPDDELVEEISRVVVCTLEEALGIEPEEARPFARLAGDLGAESIDYLDITFQFQQSLGIKINHWQGLDGLGYEHTEGNGLVSDEGMAHLRKNFPMMLAGMTPADRNGFVEGRKLSEYNNSMTVLGTAGHIYSIAVNQRDGKISSNF